jgi:zinc D-Ala-D-Ala dipeptidase
MTLVDIAPPAFAVSRDIAYATGRNVTGRPVYSRPGCYLHEAAAETLQRAIELAGRIGYGILVFDAFRPAEAQWILWNARPDPTFLADPRRGSPHSRGVAIDLTLTGGDGAALDMGTGFDAFTPLSHHGNTDIPAAAQRNRMILLGIMSAAGWDFYSKEWWHYQLFEPRRFPLLSDSVLPRTML